MIGLEPVTPGDQAGIVEEDAKGDQGRPERALGKYLAQNVAPIIADNAAPKLDTVASGGDRMRLTQT